MKNVGIIVAVLAAVFFGSFYIGKYRDRKQTMPQSPDIQRSADRQWEAKADEQGPVSITITPQILEKSAPQWTFDVALNTHSVALDYDLAQMTVLVDGNGNEYKPAAWDGAAPGGHHREGVLIFNQIQPMPEYIELKIRDVGGIAERSFKWSVR